MTTQHINRGILLLLLFAAYTMASIALAETAVGKVAFVRGTVAASNPAQPPRLLGKDGALFLGDNIQTSERSFAILKFDDGAKITVRPNSSFSIDNYIHEGQNSGADLSLHKGGVRASSGEIAKQSPDKFKIHTPKAVIRAAKADYSVRLCEADCADESANLKTVSLASDLQVAARVAEVNGSVIARTVKGDNTPRLLKIGSPVYRTDNVTTEPGASALLIFRDGGRITLDPGTEFEVAEYRYQQDGQSDLSHLKLVKGSLRALTGLIGKDDKQAYQMETPVATMGIRGTGYDLLCVGSCQSLGNEGAATGQAEGLYSHVWNGAIDQKNQAGRFPLGLDESSFIANANSAPIKLPQIPSFFLNNPRPRPDKQGVDSDKLFEAKPQQVTDPGVYVAVDGGSVEVEGLDGSVLTLDKSTAAYVGQEGETKALAGAQNFQIEDPFPAPASFNEQTAEVNFSLLSDGPIRPVSQQTNNYQCRCD